MGVVVWVEGRNRVPSPCWLTRLAHLASCRAMREPAESQSVSLCARACAHTRGTGEMAWWHLLLLWRTRVLFPTLMSDSS